MQTDTQKYPNSTVYITIAFLAIFIIMPPFCRVFFKEEEKIEDTPVQEEALSSGTLVCTKTYETTGIEIDSTATYEDGNIISNIIAIKNPIITIEGLDDKAANEYNQFKNLFDEFANVPDTNKVVAGDTTTIKLDQDIIDSLGGDEELSAHMQDALSLQNSYELSGYTCSTEQ